MRFGADEVPINFKSIKNVLFDSNWIGTNFSFHKSVYLLPC